MHRNIVRVNRSEVRMYTMDTRKHANAGVYYGYDRGTRSLDKKMWSNSFMLPRGGPFMNRTVGYRQDYSRGENGEINCRQGQECWKLPPNLKGTCYQSFGAA